MLLVIDGRMKRGCPKIWYPKIYWLMIIFPKKQWMGASSIFRLKRHQMSPGFPPTFSTSLRRGTGRGRPSAFAKARVAVAGVCGDHRVI